MSAVQTLLRSVLLVVIFATITSAYAFSSTLEFTKVGLGLRTSCPVIRMASSAAANGPEPRLLGSRRLYRIFHRKSEEQSTLSEEERSSLLAKILAIAKLRNDLGLASPPSHTAPVTQPVVRSGSETKVASTQSAESPFLKSLQQEAKTSKKKGQKPASPLSGLAGAAFHDVLLSEASAAKKALTGKPLLWTVSKPAAPSSTVQSNNKVSVAPPAAAFPAPAATPAAPAATPAAAPTKAASSPPVTAVTPSPPASASAAAAAAAAEQDKLDSITSSYTRRLAELQKARISNLDQASKN